MVFKAKTPPGLQEAHAKELELELRRGVDQLSKEHKKLTERAMGPWGHLRAMWGHAAVTFWQVKLVKPETYFGDGTMFKELQDGEFRVINS